MDHHRPRIAIDLVVLFALGAAIFELTLGSELMAGKGFWFLLPLAVLAIVAGLVEAVAFKRTQHQRRIWPWLSPVLGMVAVAVVRQWLWSRHYGDGAAPDAGMALGMFIGGFVVVVPLFAWLVIAVTWTAKHLGRR